MKCLLFNWRLNPFIGDKYRNKINVINIMWERQFELRKAVKPRLSQEINKS